MFVEALELHRKGRLEEASRGYEAVLAREPAHVDALVHLGVLRLAQDRAAEAEALLRRAVAAAPGSAEAHANLAAALQASGRAETAIAHYEQALALKPGMTDARFGLAGCLQKLDRHPEALGRYREILAAAPGHAEANYGAATVSAAMGQADTAIQYYRAALALDPDFAEANQGLGTLLARRGAVDEAVGCFRQALDVDPNYLEARLALAAVLQQHERTDEAISAYRAALETEPDNVSAHRGLAAVLLRTLHEAEATQHFEFVLRHEPDNPLAMTGLASALTASGRHAEALLLCRKAIAASPDCAPAFAALGNVLAITGDLDGAAAAYRRAVELAPAHAAFCDSLAQIAKVKPGDPVVAALEALLPRVQSLPPREQYALHFGLAKAYDDIGERERAFAHLIEGNAVKRRHIAYDEKTRLAQMDDVCRVFTADVIAARQGQGDPSSVPIFIFGMPRSGTTLVEQLLASHPDVFGAGERRELPELVRRLAGRSRAVPFPQSVCLLARDQLCQLGSEYVAGMRPLAPQAARITDKTLGNFLWAGLIHLILPNARMIHLSRDPLDTCLSCFSRLFLASELPFTYDLGELGRYYRAYRTVMSHWHAVLPKGAVLEVSYEALVEDFAAEARRIVGYCGLPWDDACLEFHKASREVRTASMAQVRQPIYRSSVGRWRPPESVLHPLLEGLGPSRRP